MMKKRSAISVRQSAISVQRSATNEASTNEAVILSERGLPLVLSRAGNGNEGSGFSFKSAKLTPVRQILVLLLLCATPVLLVAADSDARFTRLGHKMICACGCNQILLECNHVGCPLSDGMRNELAAGIQRGDSDDLILQAFVQKYGPTVLAAPPNSGFGRVAWIMPFLVLLAGFASVVLIVRSWKALPPPPAPLLPPGSPGYEDQIRRETEL